MVKPLRHLYEFGPFRLDPVSRLLLRDGQPVPLTPKAFDLLLALIEERGQVLTKDELMETVWPDTVVEENNLTRNIATLRKALGERPEEHRYIVTVPGRGYRFVAGVEEVAGEEAELVVAKRSRASLVIEEVTDGHTEAEGGPRKAEAISATAPPDAKLLAARRLGQVKRLRKIAAVTLAAMAIAAAGIRFGWPGFGGRDKAENKPAAEMEIIRITKSGNAWFPTISPDGKYIVYVIREAGRESLWLRQVATTIAQQIIPSAEVLYHWTAFAPDGDYVYFARSEKDSLRRVIYRMPALGGVAAKLIEDVDGPSALSWDGSRLAFVRTDRERGESALMVANADGTGEQKLATRSLIERSADRFGYPAWSPDGRVIACSVGRTDQYGLNMSLVEVRVADGSVREITSEKWAFIGVKAWLADGSGLVMGGRDPKAAQAWIYHLAYPGGEVRKLAGDYGFAGMTADSNSLVAAQVELISNIWIAPGGDAARARQITSGTGWYGVPCWTPDGKIVYSSTASGNSDIWVMEADGTGQRQLTANVGSANANPIVSPDGRHIVFSSNRTGDAHIWRMDSDGGNPVQLTAGGGEAYPNISPDGAWVFYINLGDHTLWKVPIHGGEARRLTSRRFNYPWVSSDGQWIASFYREEQPQPQYRIEVISSAGGPPVKTFNIPQTSSLFAQWTHDGQALLYTADREGVSNIWKQPLAGGPPQQVTDFKSDSMRYFDWSRDGRLVCIRGGWVGDVVLIRNFK